MSARPVTGVTAFNSLTGPVNEPVSVLDTNFTSITGVVNDPLNTDNFGVDTGSINAAAVTLTTTITLGAAQKGLRVVVLMAFTNTGAATLNVNGLGANAVLSGGLPIAGGVLVAGTSAEFVWNGSTAWDLVSGGATVATKAGISWATLGIYTWS